MLTIGYASQTGTAESIAMIIDHKCASVGITAIVCSLDDIDVDDMPSKLIIIASSTGDGDAPSNSQKFIRALNSLNELPRSVSFTCLGVGDSNYRTYQGFPRRIVKRMRRLGANEFYRCAEADDVVGLESIVEPWVNDLFVGLLH
jgi:sulfite reductase alpha subunit-like flavoprotein